MLVSILYEGINSDLCFVCQSSWLIHNVCCCLLPLFTSPYSITDTSYHKYPRQSSPVTPAYGHWRPATSRYLTLHHSFLLVRIISELCWYMQGEDFFTKKTSPSKLHEQFLLKKTSRRLFPLHNITQPDLPLLT